eukprot:TRINITY_DN29634_c0_g1_i1.p1 TRINITY_DN29634_c0_g1~~TRINITY_DN29634_c0_g1_i1.p1  ORF type:complete len:320 (-),score=42.08 TRINITY_DN29634_c0_g1_i1:459-1418(-)
MHVYQPTVQYHRYGSAELPYKHAPSRIRFHVSYPRISVGKKVGLSPARHGNFTPELRLSNALTIMAISSHLVAGSAVKEESGTADFKGISKVVVITGVSKGLGRALALELASRGHKVAGCARTEEKLKLLETELQGPGPHLCHAADVAVDESVAKFAAAVVEAVGVPDIVVNCAGQINPNGKLWDVPPEVFDRVIDVNLKGCANVTRHFLPLMLRRQQGGILVNFSSGWGRSAAADVAPYCASKWGVEGLTKALAKDLPQGAGLAAVALNPGVINTEMLHSCFGPTAALYASPETWAPLCADTILTLTASDNGASLSVF